MKNINKNVSKSLFLIAVLLTGCKEAALLSERELKLKADKYMQTHSYHNAAKNYFKIWCNYPNNQALLDAAKAYALAGKLQQSLELINDYKIMVGQDPRIYLVKALAYNAVVKTPLKNIDKAKKGLYNLEKYQKLTNQSSDVYLTLIKEHLEDMVFYAHLTELLEVNNPLYVLEQTQKQITSYPKHKYTPYFKQIEDKLIKDLNL